MKNRNIFLYHEAQSLPLNVFLIFYIYVFFILIIANILPVLSLTYFLFLGFGIIAICILLRSYKYHITIKKNTIALSITIPFKVLLLKLKIKEIKAVEEIAIGTYDGLGIKKSKQDYTAYLFNKGVHLKLTTYTGKIFIISCTHAEYIIRHVNALKKEL